jgi:hypothetical protein
MAIQTSALKAYDQVPITPLVIVERSPDASLHVFARTLQHDGLLTELQFQELQSHRNRIPWAPHVFIHIETPVPVCLERISQRARDGEEHIRDTLLHQHFYYYRSMFEDVTCLGADLFNIKGTLSPSTIAGAIIDIAKKYLPSPLTVLPPPVETVAMRTGSTFPSGGAGAGPSGVEQVSPGSRKEKRKASTTPADNEGSASKRARDVSALAMVRPPRLT